MKKLKFLILLLSIFCTIFFTKLHAAAFQNGSFENDSANWTDDHTPPSIWEDLDKLSGGGELNDLPGWTITVPINYIQWVY